MDMVAMIILDSTMVSVCREMGITLMKTSYSTIFNEALDFTCAIAAPNGDMLAVAEFCPAQIGGMPLSQTAFLNPGSTQRANLQRNFHAPSDWYRIQLMAKLI